MVKRYEAAIQTASSNVISRTPGRPSSSQSSKLTEKCNLRLIEDQMCRYLIKIYNIVL